MSNVNVVVLSGNLTRDPEVRPLANGNSVTKLRLASNTRRKVGDEWQDTPNYFDVTVWGAHGENIAKYLGKGDGIIVSGRLEWREWEATDGTKRQAVEIVAVDSQFMPKGGAKREAGDATLDDVGAAFTGGTPAADDDDIPF